MSPEPHTQIVAEVEEDLDDIIFLPNPVPKIVLGTTIELSGYVYNTSGALPTVAQITPGTHDLDRWAAAGGAPVNIDNDVANLEQAGRVYFQMAFTAANGFAEGDSVRWRFQDLSVTIDGTITVIPPVEMFSYITLEGEVDNKLTGITNEETVAAADYTAEATLVTWNTAENNVTWEHIVVDLTNFTVGATVTIRVYIRINGTERQVGNDRTRLIGTDPAGYSIVDGPFSSQEQIRITLESDNAGDNNVAVPLSGFARNWTDATDPFA